MQVVRKWLTQQENTQLLSLLMGGLLLRGTIALWLPPGFDEGYYYLYTQNLHWSYFDHPLLVALTTAFGPWLTGEVTQLTIRLGALLLHTGSLLLLYLTAAQLFSQKAALLTLTIASLVPIFLLGFGTLTLPDSPLIFFWTAAIYTASCEFFPKPAASPHSPLPTPHSLPPYHPSYRLAIVGLLVGLACLGKYHGLALGFGLVGFCLTTPRYRSALLSRWTVASIGLFGLAVLPIVFWNVQYAWISLRFQSGRAVPERGYSLLELLVTFLVGVCYLFPTFGLPLWWASGRALWTQRNQRGADTEKEQQLKTRFVLWVSLPLMLGFTLMGGYRPILPTWAVPGFWGATLLLGERSSLWQNQSRKIVRRWLWGSGFAVVSLLLIVLSHVAFGTLQKPSQYALNGFLPINTDASVQLFDIQQVRTAFKTLPALKAAAHSADFVFTDDIYLAGQVSMAVISTLHKPITCFNQDLRGFAFWSTREQWVGQTGLFVLPEQRTTDVGKYREYFERVQKVAEIPIHRGGAIVQVLQVYQCTKLLRPYPRPYGM